MTDTPQGDEERRKREMNDCVFPTPYSHGLLGNTGPQLLAKL